MNKPTESNKEEMEREQRIKAEEEHNQLMSRMVDNFLSDINPFGWMDIKAAMEILNDFNHSSSDLYEALTEYMESCGIESYDNIDITYIAYDKILQDVRNFISEKIDFDICNDVPGEFCVYGNYMCTSFDQSEEDKEALIKAIKEAPEDDRQELLDDDALITWLGYVDIDIKDLVA